jgi:hypothetical protein
MAKDFLMDSDGNFIIENGDFVIGDSELQEVAEIIEANPGEFKEDPIIGAALVRMIRKKYSAAQIEQEIKKHLARDGKDWNDYKDKIKLNQL